MENLLDRVHIRLEWPDIVGSSVCDESKVVKEYFAEKLASGKPGFAVDIGAADGICHNNCFELYNAPYGWWGVSVDANPRFHEQRSNLFANTKVKVCFDAVGTKNAFVKFRQDSKNIGHSAVNPSGNIEIRSWHINDFLKDYKVPYTVEFVSIDVEGLERSILEQWDFDTWKPQLFCVEKGYQFKHIFLQNGYAAYNGNGKDANGYKICHGNTFFYLEGTWPQQKD